MTADDVTGEAEPSKVRVMETRENESTKERTILLTIESSNNSQVRGHKNVRLGQWLNKNVMLGQSF
jgi:hypothetical protein